MKVGSIQTKVLKLPPLERARLIDALWASLSPSDIKRRELSWAKESERRSDAVASGKLETKDASKIFADLRRSLRK
jgi:putative addiction module component (TIGR02574 family)